MSWEISGSSKQPFAIDVGFLTFTRWDNGTIGAWDGGTAYWDVRYSSPIHSIEGGSKKDFGISIQGKKPFNISGEGNAGWQVT